MEISVVVFVGGTFQGFVTIIFEHVNAMFTRYSTPCFSLFVKFVSATFGHCLLSARKRFGDLSSCSDFLRIRLLSPLHYWANLEM